MQVVYVPRFKRKFNRMVSCDDSFYSPQMLRELSAKIKHYKDLLLMNPYLGGKEDLLKDISEDYRSLIINKRLKLIYIVIDDTIYLTDIWDTRRSINTLKEGLQ